MRRKARIDALQVLYQLDLNADLSPQAGLHFFEKFYVEKKQPVEDFTRRLVLGVTDNIKKIDLLIKEHCSNWKMDRMSAVDRNLLRMGAYEISYCDDIPATVTINEIVEIAKDYGTEQTPAFVNGLLDTLKAHCNHPGKAQ